MEVLGPALGQSTAQWSGFAHRKHIIGGRAFVAFSVVVISVGYALGSLQANRSGAFRGCMIQSLLGLSSCNSTSRYVAAWNQVAMHGGRPWYTQICCNVRSRPVLKWCTNNHSGHPHSLPDSLRNSLIYSASGLPRCLAANNSPSARWILVLSSNCS